jgi:hypothetical protein
LINALEWKAQFWNYQLGEPEFCMIKNYQFTIFVNCDLETDEAENISFERTKYGELSSHCFWSLL